LGGIKVAFSLKQIAGSTSQQKTRNKGACAAQCTSDERRTSSILTPTRCKKLNQQHQNKEAKRGPRRTTEKQKSRKAEKQKSRKAERQESRKSEKQKSRTTE
jgi:hypothetical protein